MNKITQSILAECRNNFKTIAAFCCLLFLAGGAFGQVTIASDGLNNSSSLFTKSGGAYYNGNSSNSDKPSLSPYFTEGTHSFGVTNGSASLTSNSAINSSAYTGVTMSFRLAAFSVGSTANGLDGNDLVTVEVSPDNGVNYYSTIIVSGISSSNCRWSYTTGTGIASTAYDGNNIPVVFAPAAGGDRTTDGYSTVTITGLPAVTNLKFRITLLNNATAERWVMDDVKITGTLAVVNPTVTTLAASSITTNDAILNATINANGISTATSFQYGTTVSYGSTATGDPTPVSGSSNNAVGAIVGSLALNTQYNFRAVGTVGATITNGSNLTFYTLAAVPGVLTVNNPLQTTIDITVNATTQNSNPASTQFAIKEAGGQYIQANGTLGATVVWQTASTWGTKTVTGLTPATLYTFSAKAKNGADVETAFGGTASGTTAVAQTVDFAKIQFPNTTQNIDEGGSLTVSARAYEPGLTTNSGFQSNLKGWIGYSSTNDSPSNPGWTWVPATFNADYGDDDEYNADLTGLTIGSYYYATRFQIGTGSFVYGGTIGLWSNDSVQLIVNPDVVNFANIQSPATATITEGAIVTVYAQVFEPGITEGAGQGAGITAEIGYSTSNAAPDNTWTWSTATFNVQVGNNDEYQTNLGTGLAPGTYYYASRFKKASSISGTYAYGGTNGIWSTGKSGVLTVNALATPVATAGTNVGSTSFTANWNSVVDAASYRLDVSTSPTFSGGNISLAEWTFPTDGTVVTPDVSSLNNSGKNLTTNSGSIGTVSGSTTEAATSTDWDSGTNLKYWQVEINAIGFSTVSVSAVQRSSSSGPKNFKVQYKVGQGSWINTGINVITGNNWTTGISSLTLPAECDNQADISVRWIMTSNTSVNNGTVSSTGTSRIDDIIVSSLGVAFVPGYENLNVGNVTSYEVTGLDPETIYSYRVRAVLGTNTTPNSNKIDVTTKAQTTWTITSPATTADWTNGVPTAAVNAIIDADYAETVDLTANDLTINSGNTLTIKSANTLKVAGNLVNEGSIVFESTATGTGRFDAYTGAAIAGSGQATVQRYISGKRAFRFLAPAVNTTGSILNNWQAQTHITGSIQGLNGFDATISGSPSMFTYGSASWSGIPNTNVLTLDAKTGYRLLIRGDRSINLAVVSQPNMNNPITLSATGSLVTGDVTYNSLTSVAADGFTLVANPYASPIDWGTIDRTGIKSAYQVWDPKLGTGSQRGRYVACEVGNTSIIDGAGSTASGLNQYIQTGQSFFIENETLDISGSILIKESDKVGEYIYAFKSPNSSNDVTSVGKLGVTLYEATAFSSGEYAIDGAVAISNTNFNTELDSSDVTKLLSSGEQVAFTRGGKVLGIEKVGTILPTDELAIKSINLIANKAYVWNLTLQNDFTQEQTYLYDGFTQQYHTITTDGSTTVSFDTNGGGSAIALDRFKVVFQNTTLGTQKFNKQITLYPNPGTLSSTSFYLQGITTEAKVTVYNVLGQLVPVKTTTQQNGLQVEIMSSINSGVYLVNIETDGNTAQMKWIVQ